MKGKGKRIMNARMALHNERIRMTLERQKYILIQKTLKEMKEKEESKQWIQSED